MKIVAAVGAPCGDYRGSTTRRRQDHAGRPRSDAPPFHERPFGSRIVLFEPAAGRAHGGPRALLIRKCRVGSATLDTRYALTAG